MPSKKQITLNNIAIQITNSNKFYKFQKIMTEDCSICWRGRENSPKYEESYDQLVNTFGKDFIIFFPNNNTMDVIKGSDYLNVKSSGRSLITLNLPLANFPKTHDPIQAMLYRFQAEYDNEINTPVAVDVKKSKVVKKKEKKTKLFNAESFQYFDDKIEIKENTSVGNTIEVNQLETMLLISTNKN